MALVVTLLFWQMTLNVCKLFPVLNMETSRSVVWSAPSDKAG